MAQAEMNAWCPRHSTVGAARLPGFRLELRRRSRRWGGGAADIVEAPGEEVWGVLYEVNPEELQALDAKEGAGFAYRRREVQVELAGERVDAQAYEVIEKEPEEVPPRPEYRERLVAGARERRLPKSYVEALLRSLAS